MPLTAQIMRLMSDEHLIASAHAAYEPLTSTPLERELLRRLEQYEHDVEILELLYDQGYDTVESVSELLNQTPTGDDE